MSEPKEQDFLNHPTRSEPPPSAAYRTGNYFFTLSQVTRGCSIKNSISGNVCVMGAFSMSGGFQNGTGKGRGGAMPLTPSEKACSGFLQLPFTGKAGIGVF